MTARPPEPSPLEALIGPSACMEQLRRRIAQLAHCDVNVLLQGESGTGKDLVARNLHRASARRSGPYVGVNCAAIHETLLASELFGHEAGAFTGARAATLGFFRAAEGGTILLDEIGDMGLALQTKLLRVLEDRAVVPVGAHRPVPVNVRVIAASNRDLAGAVREGSFRLDLYYRLNVVCLSILPLRDRREDIGPLVDHLRVRIASDLGVGPRKASPRCMEAMFLYDWPGNVRQLANVIHRAYVLSRREVIDVEDLPEEVFGGSHAGAIRFPTLDEAIHLHVSEALRLSDGVRTRASAMLRISRKRLGRIIQRNGIS